MSVYALFWELAKHVLHRRGRDEIYLAVYLGHGGQVVAGELEDFSWEGDHDRFCTLAAVYHGELS